MRGSMIHRVNLEIEEVKDDIRSKINLSSGGTGREGRRDEEKTKVGREFICLGLQELRQRHVPKRQSRAVILGGVQVGLALRIKL